MRIVFAEKANMVGAYIENKSSALADLSMNGKGASMEDQLKALKDFHAELLANQPQIEEAEGANKVCEKSAWGCGECMGVWRVHGGVWRVHGSVGGAFVFYVTCVVLLLFRQLKLH